MPSERVSMYRIREVLRLSAAGLTVRQVAAGARLSTGAVSKYLNAARASGVAWPVPEEWDDAELERRVYGEAACRPSKCVMPTCAAIHQELKRHRHVTLLRVGHRDANDNFVNPTVPINGGADQISGRSIVNDRAVIPEPQEHIPVTENIRAL